MSKTTAAPESPPLLEREFPERPELLAYDCWYHDDKNLSRSILYLDVDGTSPIITNHLSDIHMQIIEGSGRIAAGALVHKLEQGDEQLVRARVPYRYIGQMSLLVTARPLIIPRLVTFNNEQLGREEQRVVKRYHKLRDREERLSAIACKLETFTEKIASLASPSNVTWR